MENGFKEIAYQILSEVNKPLHSKEITRIALSRGWLRTAGNTPEATMNAQIIVDINRYKDKSRFIKTGPSTYAVNTEYIKEKKITKLSERSEYLVSNYVSSRQKGDIAEARIAELIVLYGDTTLSCYKPISDDEGIDLIVKVKRNPKVLFIQIKSRFGEDASKAFVATTKKETVMDKHKMALVFCFFDTNKGDLDDSLWFIPARDFIKKGNNLKESRLGFVAGRQRNIENKWDEYLIDKRGLAQRIIEQINAND